MKKIMMSISKGHIDIPCYLTEEYIIICFFGKKYLMMNLTITKLHLNDA